RFRGGRGKSRAPRCRSRRRRSRGPIFWHRAWYRRTRRATRVANADGMIRGCHRRSRPHRGRAESMHGEASRRSRREPAERATGFEPVTSSLGSWHSTPELRPRTSTWAGSVPKSCHFINLALGTLVAPGYDVLLISLQFVRLVPSCTDLGHVLWQSCYNITLPVQELEHEFERPGRLGVEVTKQALDAGALLGRREAAHGDFDGERVRERQVVEHGVLFPEKLPPPRDLGERGAVQRIHGIQPLGEWQHLARVTDQVGDAREVVQRIPKVGVL